MSGQPNPHADQVNIDQHDANQPLATPPMRPGLFVTASASRSSTRLGLLKFLHYRVDLAQEFV